MNIPANLKYTESHEWIRVEGDRAYVGITDYAQDSLGDIVFVELPETGSSVKPGDEVTTIESVKAAEPISSPLTGTIVETNSQLVDTPESINESPYLAHIFVIRLDSLSELDGLLDDKAYGELVRRESEV